MQILLRDGKINPAFSSSPGPSSHHWKWRRWTVQRLSPPAMQEGRAHSMTPVTKHKQLLSVTHFYRELALLEFPKLIFKKKKISNQSHLTTMWIKHCSCSFHPVHQKPQQASGHHPFVPCRRWSVITAQKWSQMGEINPKPHQAAQRWSIKKILHCQACRVLPTRCSLSRVQGMS